MFPKMMKCTAILRSEIEQGHFTSLVDLLTEQGLLLFVTEVNREDPPSLKVILTDEKQVDSLKSHVAKEKRKKMNPDGFKSLDLIFQEVKRLNGGGYTSHRGGKFLVSLGYNDSASARLSELNKTYGVLDRDGEPRERNLVYFLNDKGRRVKKDRLPSLKYVKKNPNWIEDWSK